MLDSVLDVLSEPKRAAGERMGGERVFACGTRPADTSLLFNVSPRASLSLTTR